MRPKFRNCKKQPKLHWRLRRAIRQMEVILFYGPPEGVNIFDLGPPKIEQNYYIKIKPGIKPTKWHRLAKIMFIRQYRAYLESMTKSIIGRAKEPVINLPSIKDSKEHWTFKRLGEYVKEK